MSDDSRYDMDDRYSRYNSPPETPREEMWGVIVARIREEGLPGPEIDLHEERRRRRGWSARSWAAAAAVLVIGIALGRATAPAGPETAAVDGGALVSRPTPEAGLDYAALDHLGRSESLLTMVRADAREGRMDPSVAPWARSLLLQTRLLLDARAGAAEQVASTELNDLLGELELVLMQIVGVTETEADADRMRTELDLAIGGMDDREVLTRIRAAMPAAMARS